MLSRSYWLVRERSVRSVEDAVALLASDHQVCRDLIIKFANGGSYAADDLVFHLARIISVDSVDVSWSLRHRHESLKGIIEPLFVQEAYEAIGQVLADTEFGDFPPFDQTEEWALVVEEV